MNQLKKISFAFVCMQPALVSCTLTSSYIPELIDHIQRIHLHYFLAMKLMLAVRQRTFRDCLDYKLAPILIAAAMDLHRIRYYCYLCYLVV